VNPTAFEAVARKLLTDIEARRYKLPRDIAPGEWLAEHLLHWMAEEAGPRLAAARASAARLLEELRRLEGPDEERRRVLVEAAESLERDCREIESLLVPQAAKAPETRVEPGGGAEKKQEGGPVAPEAPAPPAGPESTQEF
jgi:hypothetical protein